MKDRAAAAELTQLANDVLVDAARSHPQHFRALLVMPLQFPELAVEELDRFAGRSEVVGVIVAGSAAGRQLNDSAFMPFMPSSNVAVYRFCCIRSRRRDSNACSS